jgi:hypothetical protein
MAVENATVAPLMPVPRWISSSFMSIFGNLFDVFSIRPEASAKRKHTIPERMRTRVLMLCREVFSNAHLRRHMSGGYIAGRGDYTAEFWDQIHRLLRYRHGRTRLAEAHSTSVPEDAFRYLMTCPGEEFLDFLEYIFQVDCWSQIAYSPDDLVEDLNTLLRQDNLPYYLTEFVRQAKRQVMHGGPFGGEELDVTTIVALPRIVMRENDVLHTHAVKPVLELLQAPENTSANVEYMAALEDYRKDDFGDCLTKCGSAFESVLKVICDRKGWPYKQTATAGTLVKAFLEGTKIDSVYDNMLMTTATLRNRFSTSHGAGTLVKQVPRHVALYAINETASAILFITQEAG